MTWSIIAKDSDSGLIGIAIASRFFAVGSLCPWASPDGAVCTQALLNPLYGTRGLALLREGQYSLDIVNTLIAADEGRASRQLHVIDGRGETAAFTGEDCVDWCGHKTGPGLSVAGNMLAGPEVVTETAAAYRDSSHSDFVERLVSAMMTGESVGGDKRGKQSAAILIQGTEPYPRLSIRVDDHHDPLGELARLYKVSKERFIPFTAGFPRPGYPSGITERGRLDAIIERDAGKPLGPAIQIGD